MLDCIIQLYWLKVNVIPEGSNVTYLTSRNSRSFSRYYFHAIIHSLSFDVSSTVHHSIELFHQPTAMHNFLYSLTICLLHYYPRHVSSTNMLIFRRKNCIRTASGIFALCKRLHSTQCTVQTFTESEDTRCCVNTIFSPEDGHVNARNMSRIIV